MAFPQLSLGRLTTARLARGWDAAVPALFGLALVTLVPWRTAFRLGFDEGFELIKAWLVSRGHALYGPFWNDQPPLHTEVLAFLFRLFGPSAGMGRLLSMGLAVVLVGALYRLACRGSNRLAGVLAVVLLASASEFLSLSVAVMLELPAFALGLAAVWAWYRWADGGGRSWLVASGVLLGAALQIKFTVALLLPAFAVAWWLGLESPASGGESNGAERRHVSWRARWVWLGAVSGTFVGVVLLWYGPGAWTMMGRSHFSAATRAEGASFSAFRPALLWDDGGLVFLALVGLVVQLGQRRRDLWFPVVWVVTVLLVHWQHRPWWPYYWFHFAIPLAWLAGVGAAEVFRLLWRRFPADRRAGWRGPVLAWVVWSLVFAGGLSVALEKVVWEMQRLRRALPGEQDATVQALRVHGAGARWVVTRDLLPAFWAGLPTPELAVIPLKRLWSGQLTSEQARAVLELYRPELILLARYWRERFGLEDYLAARYQPVEGVPNLYRRR
jgi:4-amino-4-deoxy-L-arabinose transferase-like glycosyltransferase